MINESTQSLRELATLLLECSSFHTSSDNIIPEKIRQNLPNSGTLKDRAFNILKTSLYYKDGLEDLLKNLYFAEEESIPFIAFKQRAQSFLIEFNREQNIQKINSQFFNPVFTEQHITDFYESIHQPLKNYSTLIKQAYLDVVEQMEVIPQIDLNTSNLLLSYIKTLNSYPTPASNTIPYLALFGLALLTRYQHNKGTTISKDMEKLAFWLKQNWINIDIDNREKRVKQVNQACKNFEARCKQATFTFNNYYHLLIEVRPIEIGYRVSASLQEIEDPKGVVRQPTKVYEKEVKSSTELEGVFNQIMLCIQKFGLPDKKIWLILFIPTDLMSGLKLNEWNYVYKEQGVDYPRSITSHKTILRWQNRLDILRERPLATSISNWKSKWDELQMSTSGNTAFKKHQVYICSEHKQIDDSRWDFILQDIMGLGMAIAPEKKIIWNKIYICGTPLIVWGTQQDNYASDAIKTFFFQAKPISQTLPDRFFQVRHESENKDLFLIWDDPDILPPDCQPEMDDFRLRAVEKA